MLYGQLQCADPQGNLVLHSTREVLPKRCVHACVCGFVVWKRARAWSETHSPNPGRVASHACVSLCVLCVCSGAERTLGLVLVPRRHRASVCARAEDAADVASLSIA